MQRARVWKSARNLFAVAALLLSSGGALRAQAVPIGAASQKDEPYTIEYYYKAKWGYADEFLRLFKKNHLPVLQEEMKSGRILQVTAAAPRYHATEGGRWDYRVTIVFKDVVAAHDNSRGEEIVKRLYPDQETFRKEEQRRFEILEAHWDVPVVPVKLQP